MADGGDDSGVGVVAVVGGLGRGGVVVVVVVVVVVEVVGVVADGVAAVMCVQFQWGGGCCSDDVCREHSGDVACGDRFQGGE